MMTLLTQSVANASFGIYFPKFVGTIYELLSAPVSYPGDCAGLCGRGGDQVDHPQFHHHGHRGADHADPDRRISVWMLAVPGAQRLRSLSLLGFIIGIWADGFEKLQMVPLLIVQPLSFLGGSFYPISAPARDSGQGRPVQPGGLSDLGVLLVVRGHADVAVGASLGAIAVFLAVCIFIVWRIFATGYRLKA